ncbi:MAG TPA: RNA degradosome polyphosphate kinase, partial [Methylomirabilota bacterium]|nr:RNA degradosome polyphosphate kinase [Methylomirabilota bacterium]
MARPRLDNPRYYLNRHLQWLDFNRRVLEEAHDPGNPLLERVKFLAITANNLDEFVEVRVAGFLQRIEQGDGHSGPDGLAVAEELEQVTASMQSLVRDQYKCWNEKLIPALARESISLLPVARLDGPAAAAAKNFYDRRVYPMLTPVAVDPAHPFPHVLNKALCIAFLLRKRRRSAKPLLGVITVPRALPRLFRVPAPEGAIRYVFLQDVIAAHAARIYRGYEILAQGAFRVTRN